MSTNNGPPPSNSGNNAANAANAQPTYIGGYNGLNGNIGGTFPIQGGGTITIYPYVNPIVTIPIIIIPEEIAAVPEEKKKDSDGCNCKKCKEFYPQAEPNQDDGTLICWACRHGY